MFISTSTNRVDLKPTNSRDNELAKLSGLLDKRRYIHVFYDDANPLNCKVIQINISTTKGHDVLFEGDFMNRHNGTLSFVGVYTYDCRLNTIGKNLREMFGLGRLTLLTARRLDRETDHDRGVTRAENAQLYSTIFSMYSISDYIDTRTLVDPRYYTQEHEYYATGEIHEYGIQEELMTLNLIGEDIIDDVTEIFKHGPKEFDTVMDTIQLCDTEKMYGEMGTRSATASDSIMEVNYLLGCDTMINGGVVVYDTEMGIKPIGTSIIGQSFMSKESAVSEMATFLNAIDIKAKNIEKNFGSIRLMYAPSLVGSKCKVVYKEFGNTSSIGGFGSKNVKASKDNTHEVTEVIGELINENDQYVHNAIVEGLNYGHLEREKIISYY